MVKKLWWVWKESKIGFILEVDLEYPLAPEKLAIPYDMLSDYCKKNAEEYRIKVGGVKELIPNLGNKTNYVLHFRDLQLYLSFRMKLTKMDRVLKFKIWLDEKIYRF